MARTRGYVSRVLAAGMISAFALSLATAPALARGGAGDGRNDPFVESFKPGSQARKAEQKGTTTQKTQRAGQPSPTDSHDGPSFLERLFGASAKDGE